MTVEVGTMVAVISLTVGFVWREIAAATQRGRLYQRMDEVEKDVKGLGTKVRVVEEDQGSVRQSLAKIESGQEYIIKALDQLRDDQKSHMNGHWSGYGGQ